MQFLKDNILHVPKTALFFLAGALWCFAGSQILKLGLPDMIAAWTMPLLHIAAAFVVFFVFFHFIFLKLVHKHRKRIADFVTEKPFVLQFFDKKGYIIMACMITFGVLLRSAHIVPPLYLGTFYTGLGTALLLAGICFLGSFCRRVVKKDAPGAPSPMPENEEPAE